MSISSPENREDLRILQQELADTNRDVLALTLELDKRIEELRAVEAELRHSLAEKNAMHQLELDKQAAEAANRAKSAFLARMSHEIRTPMNLINGMNNLLLESPLSEKQRELVEISTRNVRRLLRLINGILDLSKVEAGELKFEAVPFDLSNVLEECASSLSAAVEGKGLHFEVFVADDVWRYWVGDVERLQQVLLNLIGNAIKFTAVGKVEVSVMPEGAGGLRIEVSDTGCGIPRDKAEMIFGSFQQADEALNRRYEGTGLGLAIAKSLVERMGGKIWLDEKPTPGTRMVFTLRLPRSTAELVSAKAFGTAAGELRKAVEPGTRVLLVEDNPENVLLVRAYLDGVPLVMDLACSGVEAVEKRQQNEYDLILMDIQMPIMDGYTATREIRAWERAAGKQPIPIVALTAHALQGAAMESIEAGCDGHMTKPVERADLLEAIQRFGQRKAASGEDSMAEMIRLRRPAFLTKRRADLERMRAALADEEYLVIQKIAHDCKGIGAGYGFPEISRVAADLVAGAKALDAAKLEAGLSAFESCVVKGESQMREQK